MTPPQPVRKIQVVEQRRVGTVLRLAATADERRAQKDYLRVLARNWREARKKAGLPVLNERSRFLRDPNYFGRVILDLRADLGGLQPDENVLRVTGLKKWAEFHGGADNSLKVAEQVRKELGENEQLALLVRAHGGQAENFSRKLLELNAGFVRKIASRYTGLVERKDLVQLSGLGLWEAAKEFRAEKNAKLLSYAPLRMRAAIRRGKGGVTDSAWTIQRSVRTQGNARKLSNLAQLTLAREGRLPSEEEKARALGSARTVKFVEGAPKTVSLFAPLRGKGGEKDKGYTRENRLADAEPFNEAVERRLDAEKVVKALAVLRKVKPDYADAVARSFGIGGRRKQSFSEIARCRRPRCTPQNIGENYARGMRMLREMIEREEPAGLKPRHARAKK